MASNTIWSGTFKAAVNNLHEELALKKYVKHSFSINGNSFCVQ